MDSAKRGDDFDKINDKEEYDLWVLRQSRRPSINMLQ